MCVKQSRPSIHAAFARSELARSSRQCRGPREIHAGHRDGRTLGHAPHGNVGNVADGVKYMHGVGTRGPSAKLPMASGREDPRPSSTWHRDARTLGQAPHGIALHWHGYVLALSHEYSVMVQITRMKHG